MGMGDLRQEYFDSQARVWDTQTPTQKQETVRHIFSELIPQISFPVLDVGSGTGILQPILIERMDYHPQIIELDIALGMLQQARLKTLNTSGIQYINGDVHFLPFADHSIASAICFESVPHFRDKPKAFRELHRILKSDGDLLILHLMPHEKLNKLHDQAGGAVYRDYLPSLAQMERLLSGSKFTLLQAIERENLYLIRARKSLP